MRVLDEKGDWKMLLEDGRIVDLDWTDDGVPSGGSVRFARPEDMEGDADKVPLNTTGSSSPDAMGASDAARNTARWGDLWATGKSRLTK